MSGEPMEPEFAVIADVYHIGEVHDSEDEAETEDEQEEIIKTEEKEKDKKPFKVTPVISPVYGYIDVDKKIVEPKKVEIKEEK